MIQELERRISDRWEAIDAWFKGHLSDLAVPVYSSVDIRNSGFKVAVVDNNLFPAGFNNLCQRCFVRGPELFRAYLEENFPGGRNILIIPESHTRNKFYLQNLARLQSLLHRADYDARFGFIAPDWRDDHYKLPVPEGNAVELYRARRKNDKLFIEGFVPDIVLSNNDFSGGVPEVLLRLSQPIIPPPAMGWHNRRKSRHFHIHHVLLKEFSQIIEWDPWLLMPLTDSQDGVSFKTGVGLEEVAEKVDRLIEEIQRKYDEYGVDEPPYVFVKNDAGTYGMAIMTAVKGDDVLHARRSQRKGMTQAKGGQPVTAVVIQEGVPTRDRFGDCWVEPVIYLIGSEVLGGFLRRHCKLSPRDNFNTTGMNFTRPCLHGLEGTEIYKRWMDASQTDYFPTVYDVISKVAALAAAREMMALTETGR